MGGRRDCRKEGRKGEGKGREGEKKRGERGGDLLQGLRGGIDAPDGVRPSVRPSVCLLVSIRAGFKRWARS